ncbi:MULTISPECIES: hypothetical protein [Salinibaculum]
MAKQVTRPKSGPVRLKDTPRPEDLARVDSPLKSLLAWLRE